MLSEDKIKLMTRLAMYEKRTGKKTMMMTKYFRSDYVSWNMLKTWIMVTIGYCIVVAVYIGYHFEEYLEELYTLDYNELLRQFGGSYLVLILVYMVITFPMYHIRYTKAMKSLRKYQKNLKKVASDAEDNRS